jgi:hypothetical protein
MDVKQGIGGWQVWDGTLLLVDGLPSNAAAWAELDRRQRRPNWKSGAAEFRDLGALQGGRRVPWTNPKARKPHYGKKRMHKRAHPIRSR